MDTALVRKSENYFNSCPILLLYLNAQQVYFRDLICVLVEKKMLTLR